MSLILPQIVPEGFIPGWHANLSSEEYHSMRDCVSSSGIRAAMRSPKTFYQNFILGKVEPPSKAMKLGSYLHMALLEPNLFQSRFKLMPDFGNMRTNASKEKRDAWLQDLPQDAIVLDEDDYEKVMRMIDSVLTFNDGMIPRMFQQSVYEKSGFFRDPVTGLKCRFRVDILREDLSILPDIKTTRDASREAFSRSIWNYGYATQLMFYAMGVEQIHGKKPDTLCFVAVENQAPFETTVWEMDEAMKSRGELEVRHGLDVIAACVKSGKWPGLQPNGAEVISFPPWTDAKGITE